MNQQYVYLYMRSIKEMLAVTQIGVAELQSLSISSFQDCFSASRKMAQMAKKHNYFFDLV